MALRGWSSHLSVGNKEFVDGRKRFGVADYPSRTTMVLVSDQEKDQYLDPGWNPDEEAWRIIECAAQYAAEGSMVEPNARIPDLEAPAQTLTFLHLVPVTEDEVIQLVGKPARRQPEQAAHNHRKENNHRQWWYSLP